MLLNPSSGFLGVDGRLLLLSHGVSICCHPAWSCLTHSVTACLMNELPQSVQVTRCHLSLGSSLLVECHLVSMVLSLSVSVN